VGSRWVVSSRLVAATIEMDDFIWAHRHSDRCDLFCRRTFYSSRVCARRSLGKDDAIMGSIPERMGIPRGSDPTGRWNRLGPEQKISDSRNLDWRINDRPHSIPIFADFDPRPRRINAGDQRSVKLRRGHIAFRRSSASPGIGIAARRRDLMTTNLSRTCSYFADLDSFISSGNSIADGGNREKSP